MESKLEFLKTRKKVPRKVHLFMKSPDGLQMDSKWTPDKLHQKKLHELHENSTWTPDGLQKNSKWSLIGNVA
jgi:hypothetical protein